MDSRCTPIAALIKRGKSCCVLNPNAGGMSTFVRQKITDLGVTVFETEPGCSTSELLRETDFEHIIVAGGDGTIHDVVNGLVASDHIREATLHLLPCGSANDYAYSLRQAAKDDAIVTADLGIAMSSGQQRAFCNVMGIGLTARVAARMQTGRKSKLYLLSLLQTLAQNRRPSGFHLEQENESGSHDSFLTFSVGVGMREGGFVTLPDAKIGDGELDYFWLSEAPLMKVCRALPTLARGRLPKLDEIKTGRLRSARIVCDKPQPIHLDGELWLDNATEVEVSILPAALRVGYVSVELLANM